MAFSGFNKDFFKFFADLAKHNDREWFQANRARYKQVVVPACQDFIIALAPLLETISPHFKCDPRPNGGSMFRINRDTRFSHDKAPYKTNAGLQFRHVVSKDFRAPGFYLHLEPGKVFLGGGVYMPEPAQLQQIREAIAEDSQAWKKARDAASIKRAFGALSDIESLKRPPRGFAPDHPMIDDIKRKSFIVMRDSSEDEAASPAFVKTAAKTFADCAPLMRFLCKAVEVDF